jgi:hypothetical protein
MKVSSYGFVKRRSLLALALAAAPWLARAQGAPTAMGSHGMAVFGGHEGLYASHLPMFHAPHDTQLVFRFHLADAPAEQALRETLASRPRLWTFDPEPFDLLRFTPSHAQPLREFSARFFDGHFERGGTPQPATQRVVVDAVLMFKRLSPAARGGRIGRYHLLGHGAEWFAFKEIDRRPDFDQIVRLTAPTRHEPVLRLLLDGVQPPGAALQQAFGATALTELYFETGDLR